MNTDTDAVTRLLKRAIDLLDTALGDSDPMIDDDMPQEEIEAEYPVMCAMQILTNLLTIQCTPTAPAQSTRDACQIDNFSSRACRYGTRSCISEHTAPAQSGQWFHCSPALIKAGVSCANTPRRACACDPENVGHDHFIAHIAAPAQSCGDAEQADAPMTAVAPEIQRNAIALLTAPKLPDWFDAFLTNVCEIPDRNSPDDEPDAIVATLEELRECALNAIANAPFDESASCDVEAAALRAFDHATKDGFSRDLESYCAGYIDRHYALPCAAEQADEAVTASWINGVAIELWKTADVAGFDDFKLAVGGFLRATADAARAKDSK